jgi:predicted kinase
MPMPFSYLGNEKVKTHEPTLHVMVGLPGSGKNSLIEELKAESIISSSAIILSRDDIRVELGLCSEDEKIVGTEEQEKQVTKVFNQRLNQAMKEGKDIVVNNINLTEKRRKALRNQLPKYNYVYWYVEAPTLSDNLVRRYSQIDKSVFNNMLKNFEFPQTYECDLLYVYKQQNLTDDEEF